MLRGLEIGRFETPGLGCLEICMFRVLEVGRFGSLEVRDLDVWT